MEEFIVKLNQIFHDSVCHSSALSAKLDNSNLTVMKGISYSYVTSSICILKRR